MITYLSQEAARSLRDGVPFVRRDDIVRIEGEPTPGEPVVLLDEEGRSLGLGDLDLDSPTPIRRIGLPDETAEGLVPRHIRRAMRRRALFVQNPMYCRLVNEDGDGLPGLVVDRYGEHFVMQTFSRAMDARVEEIARSLVEVSAAGSVLLRNDSARRERLGLARTRARVLFGKPPRWTRVLELEARLTIDLFEGAETGYFYDQRRVRRLVARMAHDARVLDCCCYVGGFLVHAGRAGAREVVAFDIDEEAVRLARENAAANGLLGRVTVEVADAFSALESGGDPYDLVLLDYRPDRQADEASEEGFTELLRLCMRNTRHEGYVIVNATNPPVSTEGLDAIVARACGAEGRVAFRLARPGLPFDFPAAVGSPSVEEVHGVAIELT